MIIGCDRSRGFGGPAAGALAEGGVASIGVPPPGTRLWVIAVAA